MGSIPRIPAWSMRMLEHATLLHDSCGWTYPYHPYPYMAVGQNLVPLVNIKIAGKWMFIPLKMVLIGIDS